jgi:hypothetical protein
VFGFFAIALFWTTLFFGLAWIGMAVKCDNLRAEAINRGLAQYCPTNGVWAWKGECND